MLLETGRLTIIRTPAGQAAVEAEEEEEEGGEGGTP